MQISEIALVDYLAAKAGCMYVSDLHFLSQTDCFRLSREVERLPSESASLFEWNDALEYIVGAAPELTPEAAREKLMNCLGGEFRV